MRKEEISQNIKEEKKVEQNKLGLYIHIPFCKYICKYCDFCKKYIKNYDTSSYVDSLILNLKMYEDYFYNISTIYIGGGTPSSLPLKDIEKLLKFLNNNINLTEVEEFTIEANPDDISEDLLHILSKYQINRMSLGVQSLNNKILKEIGRDHTKEDVENVINLIPKYIDNLNVDLMFNLPLQNKTDIQLDLDFIEKNQENITHISYYSLILEENTILYNQNFMHFSEDEEDDIYKYIQSKLKVIGYNQYEISNYAKEGFLSRHNMKYWTRGEYIGVGLGASGFLNNQRYTVTRSYQDYISSSLNGKIELLEEELIDSKEEIEEIIMLGLRTNVGIHKKILIDNNIKVQDEYFIEQGENIIINPKYYFLSNEIILNILEKLDN